MKVSECQIASTKLNGDTFLKNKLHQCNFEDGAVSVVVYDVYIEKTKKVFCKVSLGSDGEFCLSLENVKEIEDFRRYIIEFIEIFNEHELVRFQPVIVSVLKKEICIRVPKRYERCLRPPEVLECTQKLDLQLISKNGITNAELLWIGYQSLFCLISWEEVRLKMWLNTDKRVTVTLSKSGFVHYTGITEVEEAQETEKGILLSLHFYDSGYSRFPEKKFRSRRLSLVPSPDIIFKNPFNESVLSYKIRDISGGGVSFRVPQKITGIFPGLNIPNVKIVFGFKKIISLDVQFLYCNDGVDGEGCICGACFINICPAVHTELMQILQQAHDANAYVDPACLSMEKLWNFFFETGFVYPEKYNIIASKKEKLKELYSYLYTENPSVVKNFIYQDGNEIIAHISMLRLFDRAWLVHHHAGDKRSNGFAGIKALSQLSRYINEVYRIETAKINYVFCFFRPNNKFPARVLGGVARYLKGNKVCSIDEMSYISSVKSFLCREIDTSIRVYKASSMDFNDAMHVYENISGGLFFRMMNFENSNSVQKSYEKSGFERKKEIYTVKKGHVSVGLVVLLQTMSFMNMSNLSNTIIFLNLQPGKCESKTILTSIKIVSELSDADDLSALIFPAESSCQEVDKNYALWILNLEHVDDYFRYCTRLFKSF